MDTNKITKNEKTSPQINNSRLYLWGIIENIVTILAISGLFLWSGSAWSFLLLLNINTIKDVFKKQF